MKCWEVLEQLHNWRLLKKGSAPWVNEYGCLCVRIGCWKAVVSVSSFQCLFCVLLGAVLCNGFRWEISPGNRITFAGLEHYFIVTNLLGWEHLSAKCLCIRHDIENYKSNNTCLAKHLNIKVHKKGKVNSTFLTLIYTLFILWSIDPLLGNNLVYTSQRTRNNESCVLCGPCYSSLLRAQQF
jgi:hypothetical protein